MQVGILGGSREAAQALSDLRAMGIRRRQAAAAIQRAPKDGSALRAAFDLLMASKGVAIPRPAMAPKEALAILRDFYGMDIRVRRAGPAATWQLVGATIGADYHDYIAGTVTPQRDR